jgi:hypothetical protein
MVYNNNFHNRFLPYIQPYEFEALLFSDVAKLIEVDSDWDSRLVEKLQNIKNGFETPEHINNSKETSPSHRLQSLLKYHKKRQRYPQTAPPSSGGETLARLDKSQETK